MKSCANFLVCVAALAMCYFDAALLLGQSESSSAGQSAAETIYEPRDVTTPPRATYAPNPEYSEQARKKKISGTVMVEMIVLPNRAVRDVKVIKNLEPSLDEQALAAVRTWKFEPGTKDGKPVAVHVKAEVFFRIR